MVKLKLTLKSNKPSNVYALNGKSYRLQPGSNTLVLEYNDYVSLAKALGIKPVEKDEAPATKKEGQKPAPVEEVKKVDPIKTEDPVPVEDVKKEDPVKTEEPVNEPKQEEPTHTDEPETVDAAEEHKAEEPVEEKEPEHTEEHVEEKEEIDYSTWSLSKLKVEYKRITGNTCKLKKAEVIQFLQEHNSNV